MPHRPFTSGDRIFYVGSEDHRIGGESIWGIPLTVHRVESSYLDAMKADGSYTSWMDFEDVVLVEGDRCDD
jgi:hypothetical protein